MLCSLRVWVTSSPRLRIDTTGLDAGQVVRRAYDFITYYVE